MEQIEKPMVLFIDDEESILSAMRRLFMDEPYEILFANNAIEGMKVLQNTQPDVIICDIKMPVMNGIEFLTNAKEIHPTSIRIILSGVLQKSTIVKAIRDGNVWKYILKPWKDEQLIETVREAVKISPKTRSKQNVGHNFNMEKKIFFLYPHEIVHEELIVDLIFDGYECYELHDDKSALRVFRKYTESLAFMNIDKKLKNLDWESYIRNLLVKTETSSLLIGILSYNTDPALRKLYLISLGIQCGFIQLKASYQKIRETFIKVFEANEAKGRRQAVRALVSKSEDASFNIKFNEKLFHGNIIDISKMAMACTLHEHPKLEVDDRLENVQLKLKGVPIQTSGIVKIKRIQNGEFLFIISFTHQKPETGKKICNFVYKSLNERMKKTLAN